jgi:hypothetical protein
MRRSALVENLWRDGLRRENRGVLVGRHTRYALYKAIDYPSVHIKAKRFLVDLVLLRLNPILRIL